MALRFKRAFSNKRVILFEYSLKLRQKSEFVMTNNLEKKIKGKKRSENKNKNTNIQGIAPKQLMLRYAKENHAIRRKKKSYKIFLKKNKIKLTKKMKKNAVKNFIMRTLKRRKLIKKITEDTTNKLNLSLSIPQKLKKNIIKRLKKTRQMNSIKKRSITVKPRLKAPKKIKINTNKINTSQIKRKKETHQKFIQKLIQKKAYQKRQLKRLQKKMLKKNKMRKFFQLNLPGYILNTQYYKKFNVKSKTHRIRMLVKYPKYTFGKFKRADYPKFYNKVITRFQKIKYLKVSPVFYRKQFAFNRFHLFLKCVKLIAVIKQNY